MTRLNFKIEIHASASRVWNILWADKTYRQWASAFAPETYVETDWKEGSFIEFLGADGNGLQSSIEKLIPEKFMSFKHLNSIRNRIVQPEDEESKKWSGALENYTLTENDGLTTLDIEADIAEGYLDVFSKAYPLALAMIKTLSEK
jgi:uncharacterized protein YndB with AHSA1/START domain